MEVKHEEVEPTEPLHTVTISGMTTEQYNIFCTYFSSYTIDGMVADEGGFSQEEVRAFSDILDGSL